jgi:hypothetical protein
VRPHHTHTWWGHITHTPGDTTSHGHLVILHHMNLLYAWGWLL